MFVPITDDDVPRIVALINRAYRSSGSSAGWSTESAYITGDRTTDDLLRADLRAKPEALLLKWIAPHDNVVLGCVWLEPLGNHMWYLGSLATDLDRQNVGLGKILLSAAEEWVRKHGGVHVRISVVNVRETLISWYIRRGYQLTGETEPFPYGDDRFGIPLLDDLSFLVLEKRLVA